MGAPCGGALKIEGSKSEVFSTQLLVDGPNKSTMIREIDPKPLILWQGNLCKHPRSIQVERGLEHDQLGDRVGQTSGAQC